MEENMEVTMVRIVRLIETMKIVKSMVVITHQPRQVEGKKGCYYCGKLGHIEKKCYKKIGDLGSR